MRQTFHPAMFLGAAILLCTAWLLARPPVPVVRTFAPSSSAARVAPVRRAWIELDAAVLERYAGQYAGRGGFAIDLTLKDGKLFAQSMGAMPSIPFEMRATSQTEFFLEGPGAPVGVDIAFDLARDGTVRGFSANTEFGVIEVTRAR